MKILIVNFSELDGGAAKAANRLHKALLIESIDSTMLVEMKNSDDYTISSPKSNMDKLIAKSKAMINIFPLRNIDISSPFSVSFSPSFNTISRINSFNPDIVHFHWINAGMIKIEDFNKINAPIVWSLHDMWPFTGGCHYAGNCDGYKNSCGSCPILVSDKKNDLSSKLFKRKKKVFDKLLNLTVVGLSKWMAERAKESSLFKGKDVVNLPNPIDTELFKPFDKSKSRELWGLPNDKKLILFGAMKATSDTRKGFKQLCESLLKLKTKNIELIVYGSTKPLNSYDFGFEVHYLGQLYDSVSLTSIYNAADVMIVPSLQENLSNVIVECLACGTPVVGFDIGGNSDMIDHKINGFLAKPYDSIDLAYGIDWILSHDDHESLCKSARKKILEGFKSEIVAKKYIALYTSILNNKIMAQKKRINNA